MIDLSIKLFMKWKCSVRSILIASNSLCPLVWIVLDAIMHSEFATYSMSAFHCSLTSFLYFWTFNDYFPLSSMTLLFIIEWLTNKKLHATEPLAIHLYYYQTQFISFYLYLNSTSALTSGSYSSSAVLSYTSLLRAEGLTI